MSAGLNLLISQRLLRKLCDKCKKPAQFSPTMAEELRRRGIEPKGIFEPQGCDHCGGTGYYGRMAVCDLLPITDELRNQIAGDPTVAARLRTEGEKRDRFNMKNEALQAVVAGITSLEEIKRVIQ
jgi:type II secretory ATPase GspE/PulE/Tfp pilus assembly ATPase PilB-like protein